MFFFNVFIRFVKETIFLELLSVDYDTVNSVFMYPEVPFHFSIFNTRFYVLTFRNLHLNWKYFEIIFNRFYGY